MADDDDRVLMQHPETLGVGSTNRHAFDNMWAGKGWREITDAVAADALRAQAAHDQEVRRLAGGLTVPELQRETKAVLVEIAGQLGQSVDPKATKAELVEQVSHPQHDE